ncbi:MAG: response regulator [archaeon]
MKKNKINVLLVEDNPGDILITKEALEDINLPINLKVTKDGENALNFLQKKGKYKDEKTPDFIILDLNLPRVNGFEVLHTIKNKKELNDIPIVILSSSGIKSDILETYDLHANCYFKKPSDVGEFIEVVQTIGTFWGNIAQLPSKQKINKD